MKFTYPPGATPLNLDEAAGLLLPIETQEALNKAEYQAILTARLTYARRRFALKDFLSITGLLNLHKEMFGDVWNWAGVLRKTEKNIGVAPHQIQMQLKVLLENTLYRSTTENEAELRELLAQFHHRLVLVHPFVNGNGRHSRFATEILARLIEAPEPKWGQEADLANDCPGRVKYIAALRQGDKEDLQPLIKLMFPS